MVTPVAAIALLQTGSDPSERVTRAYNSAKILKDEYQTKRRRYVIRGTNARATMRDQDNGIRNYIFRQWTMYGYLQFYVRNK